MLANQISGLRPSPVPCHSQPTSLRGGVHERVSVSHRISCVALYSIPNSLIYDLHQKDPLFLFLLSQSMEGLYIVMYDAIAIGDFGELRLGLLIFLYRTFL